jgi:gamma-glutamyltranspeptidase/glutathione hydrolase
MLRSACLILLLVGTPVLAEDAPKSAAVYQKGVVAADHPLASEAGAKMLRQGGNAVDAAVATSFALSVVRPASCGIGGGGFMLIWDAKTQKAIALDYRERAPAAATATMFAADSNSSQIGGKAVAVPGTVAGLCFAAENYGRLDRPRVLEPAIELCRNGRQIDLHDIEVQREMLQRFSRREDLTRRFRPLVVAHLNDGGDWKLDDNAESHSDVPLLSIAKLGRDGFYEGQVAEAIVKTVRDDGGILTMKDLQAMQPIVREPLRGSYGDWDIITMPPPSSGGVALLETLGILESWDRQHPDQTLAKLEQNSPTTIHVIVEALKHAFADRAEFLGDADFVDVPVERLLARERLDQLAKKIDVTKTLMPADYGRFAPPRDAGTSHFSVMDAEGNAVACTETINMTYGSLVVTNPYGIVLNNEMDDFTSDPGQPNAYGLIQSANNAIAPGKKPLSSMTPTLVFQRGDSRPLLAVGGSGGPRIITTTLQILLNATRFELPPEAAVTTSRLHHQWMPDELLLEPSLDERRRLPLQRLGHQTVQRSALAVGQLTIRTPEGLWGVSDPRKYGRPAGW